MADVDDSLLVVSQSYPPEMGGNAARIGDMTRFLDDEEWDITVLAPHPTFPHGQYDREWTRETAETHEGVGVRRLWTWQPAREDPPVWSRLAFHLTFALHAFLWVALTERSFDAVLTSTPPIFTAIPGFLARGRWRCPWVVDVRDLWIDAAVDLEMIAEGGIPARLSRFFQGVTLRTSDRLFVTTPTMRSHLLDRYPGVDEEKIRVVPNGVDVSRFDVAAGDGVPVTDGSPAEDGLIAIYTGNIGHAQNLEAVIKAIARVDTGYRFRIVGDGDRRPELERVAEEVGVDDAVEFVGMVDREEVDSYLGDAAVGLAPIRTTESLQYAVPTKVYEYLACGLPVVATGEGAIESFVDSTGGGVVVENDAEAIASALDRLGKNRERRERLGRVGRQAVVENYDREVIATDVSGYLRTLVRE